MAELFNYQPPALGYQLDSTALSSGFHTIVLRFLDSAGHMIVDSLPLKILVNNQPCVATLSPPRPECIAATGCECVRSA